MIRVHFIDDVNTCTMYRTFDALAEALAAIAKHEARNTLGQYRYYRAAIV